MNAPRLGPIVAALIVLAATPLHAREKVVAYVPAGPGLAAFAATIEYAKVTHINIAFENPKDDVGNLSDHDGADVLIAKAHANGVEVLVSIAGGGVTDGTPLQARYFGLISANRRAGFVAKLAAYVDDHRLDGIDVDLEGPSINADYGPFIRDLSAALRPRGKLLTAALSHGYGGANVPDSALASLDFVNVMAYDAAGPWRPDAPGQHSSMAFAKTSVEYWRKRGLPPSKIVLGVPFYGYGFGKDFRKGGYSYATILKAHPGADRLDKVGETIWYNGVPTVEAKARYARETGLGGIMIWSLHHDVKGNKSLLDAIHRTLGPPVK